MSEPLKVNKNKSKTILFCLLIFVVLSASVVFASMAAERSGMYWATLDVSKSEDAPESNRGFMMVDVSDLLGSSGLSNESSEV